MLGIRLRVTEENCCCFGARKLESITRYFFGSNVVKYECESKRNVQSATKIKNILCAAVGTASRQNGEEEYAEYGCFQNTLKNDKGKISSCKNCLSFHLTHMFDVGLQKFIRIAFLAVRLNSDLTSEPVRFLKTLKN